MTTALFRDDAYLQDVQSTVCAHTPEGGIILDATVFYPTGGGQPGDSGRLEWSGGALNIATSIKDDGEDIILVPAEPAPLPSVGTLVTQRLDWVRRHRHMRVHTALHLLSVVIPLPVTGGSISAEKGRLDFAMDAPPEDKAALEAALNALIEQDLKITDMWITDEELLADPSIVKTMSVMPPTGQGHVRLVRIGDAIKQVDLQPCGGTHVARTSEIGRIRIGKIEKKGRMNRRVAIYLD
ncbi:MULTISPECIES: alanyl-tRNA editing protein [Pacificibacter]|uniref:alanyl-tRNA editing protein n=1 Tax=Pacificibacter TaxID=1042323 RepID=UPI001C0A1283|nr:alanyl-tRNA editing protein [Pacificibacter sp. 1_MG-2023]MBU2935584.1 alanyl-tRNA editing protein [Pacificibacter marinus]MDO6614080.1 alanyl-tRNA editing protein [Pacificibacter sp. 1_MG-2023]